MSLQSRISTLITSIGADIKILTDRSDGWIVATAWTFATATTFTVAGDLTTTFTTGTRLKLTQTSVKYFVVVSSSHSAGTTTVTFTGGSDYTLANAAISANYYSYAANPRGYPGWFSYAPAATGFSSKSSDLAKFCVNGRTCFVIFNITGTSNLTTFSLSAPIALSSTTTVLPCGPATVQNNTTGQIGPGRATMVAGSTVITMAKDWQATSWTASGTKVANGFIEYEI